MVRKYRQKHIGKTFGKLTIIDTIKISQYVFALCSCSCGNQTRKRISDILSGSTTSCGCASRKYAVIEIGNKYGKLTVIAKCEKIKHKVQQYVCKCDCGIILNVNGINLRNGNTKTCSCSRNNTTIKGAIYTILNCIFLSTEKDSKKRGLPFLLNKGEYALLIQLPCFYSDTIINIAPIPSSSGKLVENTKLKINGLDRIDNHTGYELGNVLPCNKYINFARNNFYYNNFIEWIYNLNSKLEKITVNNLHYPEINDSLTNKEVQEILKNLFPVKFKHSKFDQKLETVILTKIRDIKNNICKSKILSLKMAQIAKLVLAPCVLCNRKVDIAILKNVGTIENKSVHRVLNQIDRWDNSIRSYTVDNSTTLCYNCNSFKNDQEIYETQFLIDQLKLNITNIPKTLEDVKELYSPINTIKLLINNIENNKIMDAFDELPKLKQKLEILQEQKLVA